MFKFEKSETMLENGGGLNIADLLDIDDTQMYQAAFLGRCKTLFGEPYSTSDDNEALYSYYIKALEEDGSEVNLEIYYGSGGPSVGVEDSETGERAAIELAKLIMEAEPSDYKIASSYDDLSVRIVMGVENGEPFYKTLLPGMSEDMPEEEMMKAMEEFFG